MRPLAVLIGIVMGSAVSLAVGLALTWVVFLFLPDQEARLAPEKGPLMRAVALFTVMAAVAAASFLGEVRSRDWRPMAHGALLAGAGGRRLGLLARVEASPGTSRACGLHVARHPACRTASCRRDCSRAVRWRRRTDPAAPASGAIPDPWVCRLPSARNRPACGRPDMAAARNPSSLPHPRAFNARCISSPREACHSHARERATRVTFRAARGPARLHLIRGAAGAAPVPK